MACTRCDASVTSLYTTADVETMAAPPRADGDDTAQAVFSAVLAANRLPARNKTLQQPDDDDDFRPMKPQRRTVTEKSDRSATKNQSEPPTRQLRPVRRTGHTSQVSLAVPVVRPVPRNASTVMQEQPPYSARQDHSFRTPLSAGPPRVDRYNASLVTVPASSAFRPLVPDRAVPGPSSVGLHQQEQFTPRQRNSSGRKTIHSGRMMPPTAQHSHKTLDSDVTPRWGNTSAAKKKRQSDDMMTTTSSPTSVMTPKDADETNNATSLRDFVQV